MEDLVDKIDILAYIEQYVQLKPKGNEFVGLSPFTNEKTPSFFVCPDKKCWYCFSCGEGGTVIKFVQKYHKVNYTKAVQMLISWANISLLEEENIVKVIKKYKKKEKEIIPARSTLNENIMDSYKDILITSWIEEGISPEVLKKYMVRYDDNAVRIVFPIWDLDGKIINVKGRAAHAKWKEFGMAKYIYYYPLGRNDLLWGYHFHFKDIVNKNEIILVEGEKSVMKLESNGWNNAVAIGTSHLSKEQMQILLKLRVNVVIALDKDKNAREDKNFANLSKYNKCFVIEDKNNLIGDKDSPIDKGIEIFKTLYDTKELF